jgi:hypothetical protein
MVGRREEVWEARERRLAGGDRRTEPPRPPPRVVPDTGVALEDTACPPRSVTFSEPTLSQEHAAAGVSNLNLSQAEADALMGLMSGSGEREEGRHDPEFESVVQREMAKLEREFQNQLKHEDLYSPARHESGLLHRKAPAASGSSFLTAANNHSQSARPDGSELGPSLSRSPESPKRLLGFGRGLNTLYSRSPGEAATAAAPGQASRGVGFGRGISSLYESPDVALKRKQQQEYSRALSEQMREKGSGRSKVNRGADKENQWAGEAFEAQTGLSIGVKSDGAIRRVYPGLDRMFKDPDEQHAKSLHRREYARALDAQVRWILRNPRICSRSRLGVSQVAERRLLGDFEVAGGVPDPDGLRHLDMGTSLPPPLSNRSPRRPPPPPAAIDMPIHHSVGE